LLILEPEKVKQKLVEKQLIGSCERYEVWLMQAVGNMPGLSFEPYLYNRADHLRTQHPDEPFSVSLWDRVTQKSIALLCATPAGPRAISLARAPFGGLQFASGTPPDALFFLLSCLENWCRAQALTQLILKAPPTCYGEEESLVAQEAYHRGGFHILEVHANHHIPVSPVPFEQNISSSERRKLRRCLRAQFSYGPWADPDLAEAYAFLFRSRKSLGYSLPMNLAEFVRLLSGLPEAARVFTVRDGTRLISLTVAIRVSKHVLYNFCPADDLAYRMFSPTVMLNAALYEYAQEKSIRLIDLGVSLDESGQEKASLIRFKEHLGGQRSVKLTYGKFFESH
jgi:hypothetical protein